LKSIIVIALSLLAGSYVCSAVDESAELAVIVNKAMPSETAEPAELRLMFLGEKPKWSECNRRRNSSGFSGACGAPENGVQDVGRGLDPL
jgi:hypothetical protein